MVVESLERAEGAIDGMALGHLAARLPHPDETCQAPGIITLGLSIALMQKKRPALSDGQVPYILSTRPGADSERPAGTRMEVSRAWKEAAIRGQVRAKHCSRCSSSLQ
jgi:hypothetical protein